MKFSTKFVHAGLYLALLCTLAACLGGSESSTTTPVTPTPATPLLALFAGDMGGAGNADGPVATARFSYPTSFDDPFDATSYPTSIAADSMGNIYIAESGNNIIRKISPTGLVSTFAGLSGVSGSTDGTGSAARFYYPASIAADSTGNVYVADAGNYTIRKITPAGEVTTLAGSPGVSGSADGLGATARFGSPSGVAADSMGNVYVADVVNLTIRKISPAGAVSTLAGTPGVKGDTNGTGAAASFLAPISVATDSTGSVYVVDSGSNTIRKITPNGEVSTLAGTPGFSGSADGIGRGPSFYDPTGIATDSTGNVYVTDYGKHTLRKITPARMVSTLAGTPGVIGSADAIGASASFYKPYSVTTDSAGNIYVADNGNYTIRKITPSGTVTTLAGTPSIRGSTDGTGAAARFDNPHGVATDSTGNVYVADMGNNTIRKITPGGVVSTLAGSPGIYGTTDGLGSAASFPLPLDVAVDGTGNVYATAWNTIRKIAPNGAVTTLAGTAWINGSTDGTGASAGFNHPVGVATDAVGNVYVADSGNHTIRKISPAGVVATLAGAAGIPGSTDGVGAVARFSEPGGVAADNAGNVYVADTGNNTIRKISPTGEVTTLAGSPGISGSVDGTGISANFNHPSDVATDSAGNVYVADTGNNTIRKINPTGVVSTVVGVAGVAGFTPGNLPGVLSSPVGVAISGTTLYVTTYNGVAVVNNVP